MRRPEFRMKRTLFSLFIAFSIVGTVNNQKPPLVMTNQQAAPIAGNVNFASFFGGGSATNAPWRSAGPTTPPVVTTTPSQSTASINNKTIQTAAPNVASSPNPPPNSNMSINGTRPLVSNLPDGRPLGNLSGTFEVYNGKDEWSRIVANGSMAYVMHPVQADGGKIFLYDPWTIGQVLGYIYELTEFGGKPPPGGFTITLMGKPLPERFRRSLLIFRKKKNSGKEQN